MMSLFVPTVPRYGRQRLRMAISTPVESRTVELPTGIRMEVRAVPGESSGKRVMFVHGAMHSAWCWDNFLQYFTDAGFQPFSVSLRGTSKSPAPGMEKPKVSEHVDDLRAVIDAECGDDNPIIVSHSLGGTLVLKYLEAGWPAEGAVFLCSAPPSGGVELMKRLMLSGKLVQFWRLIRGFGMKIITSDAKLARELFFTKDDDDSLVQDAMRHFQEDSELIIDQKDMEASLPSKEAGGRRAAWIDRMPPVAVFGAEMDTVVDEPIVREVAEFVGVEPRTLGGFPHDIMLTARWQDAADLLRDELRSIAP